jgi:hypothetical protein
VKKLLVALAAGAVATSLNAVPAHAGPPVAGPEVVRPCGFDIVSDPRQYPDPNAMTGAVDAAVISTDPGMLTCTVQVNGPTYQYPDTATRAQHTTAVGPANVAVLAQQIDYETADGAQDYLCTSWIPDDPTKPVLYWHTVPLPGTSHWTTDATTYCGTPPCQCDDPLLPPVFAIVDDVIAMTEPTQKEIDTTICPQLVSVHDVAFPGAFSPTYVHDPLYVDDDGDVYVDDDPDQIDGGDLYWDCPPYRDLGPDPLQ